MDLLSHLLGIAGLFLGLLFLYKRWRVGTLTRNKEGMSAPEPPGAWPIIGHLHLLSGRVPLFRTLAAMADKHGPVFMIQLGMHRTIVVSSHEVVKECFTTNDQVFASRPRSCISKILGCNYAAFGFAPYGPFWREMRKISVLQILSSRRLNELKNVQISELEACIKDLYSLGKDSNWVSPIEVVMSEWFEHFTFNFILRMIAGKRYFDNAVHGNEEARGAVLAIQKFLYLSGAFVPSDVFPFLEFLDLKGYLASMKHVAKELDSLVGGWVEEHAVRLKSKPGSSQDFIDVILSELQDTSMFGHNRETVIKATIMSLIVGGSDSTSLTSTWVLSALLNNRQAMKHAQEEIDLKVGRGRWVEESNIQNLTYLRAIIKESLRLYPAAPLLVPHEATQDCVVSGYHIPKGTRLMVNAWKLHRDPRVWSNPQEFQPERFLGSHADVDVYGHQFELVPFGSGRRACPGINMALQMLHLTFSRLLQGFDISTPSNHMVDMTEGISFTMPKLVPLQVLLSPRLPSQLYQY